MDSDPKGGAPIADRQRPPRVSIVIPAFNREKYLGRTIDSVLAQTIPEWELLVSDDGSTDGTAVIAEEYAARDPRITVLRASNGGVARARNRGLAASDTRSEFVTFLDSDDRWFADTLEAMVGVLDEHPELVSVYGVASCIDDADRPIPGDDLAERMRERYEYRGRVLVPIGADDPLTFAGIVYHNYPVTPGLHLVRRSVLDQVGSFDPETDPADDWDMAVRISRHGPIGFLDRLVLEWRRHPATLTESSPRWRRAHDRTRAKMLAAPENTPEQRRLATMGYLGLTRGLLQGAWTSLRSRQPGEAARNAAKAVDVAMKYIVVAVLAAVRRHRPGTGPSIDTAR